MSSILTRICSYLFKTQAAAAIPATPKTLPQSILEPLEGRIAPAFVASVAGGILKVIGDSADNIITIKGDAVDLSKFTLSSTEAINGTVADFVVTGVINMKFQMGDGNDEVTFDGSFPSTVKGSILINGGNGANAVNLNYTTVQKNVTVTNGTNLSGMDNTNFVNANIAGSVTITNGDGDTQTGFYRLGTGSSTVGGNFKVSNGTGTDGNYFRDVNFAKSVTINNGLAKPTDNGAGYTHFYNTPNIFARSVVKGNVSVSYLNGNVDSDGLWDQEVFGNVTFNYGTATARIDFEDNTVGLSTYIHGNLTIKGTGALTANLGFAKPVGTLRVGKNLSIQTGAQDDAIDLQTVIVHGKTSLNLGDGTNSVTMDNSCFYGALTVRTGNGSDTVAIDTSLNLTRQDTDGVVFQNTAVFTLGGGTDSYVLAGSGNETQAVIVWKTLSIIGAESGTRETTHEYFPFGGSIRIL